MQAKQYNAMDTNFYSNGLNHEQDFKEWKFKNIMLVKNTEKVRKTQVFSIC